MKICALTHTYPRFPSDTNGPFVEFLMEELAARGNEVHVLSAYDPEFVVDRPGRNVHMHLYRYVIPRSLHILGYSRTIQADIHLKFKMLLLAPFMFIASIFAFYRLVKKVKPDVIQAHWFLPNGFSAAVVSRLTGVPLLATLHGSDVFVAEKGGVFRLMTRFANSTLTRLSSCSPELRDRVCDTGFPKLQSRVIPYAVDPKMENPSVSEAEVTKLREEYDLLDKPVLLCLGRLVYKKGYEFAIRAMPEILKHHADARLVIAGGGDLENELKRIAAEMGVTEAVIFTGTLFRDRIPAHMAMADIFLMPSIHDTSRNVDGLPNVILEAMAFGKPVIATNITGIPLAVHDRVNGRLVDEQSADQLSSAISELLDNPDDMAKYGVESRRLIADELNWRVIADRYEQLFGEMLAK